MESVLTPHEKTSNNKTRNRMLILDIDKIKI